jgi:hypothetical protein
MYRLTNRVLSRPLRESHIHSRGGEQMRKVLLVGFLATLAILMSAETQAQTHMPPSPRAPLESNPLQFDKAQWRQGPPRRVHRCCNLKGALIGAGIGAAIGAFSATLCDAGDCTLAYIKSIGIMGSIGGVLGAFVERRQGFGPLPKPPVFLDDSRIVDPPSNGPLRRR